MVDIPDLPQRKNFGKVILGKYGPAYYSIAAGLEKATKKGKRLHALEPYKNSIIKAISRQDIRKIHEGGFSDTDQKKLFRKILALDDKTPKKPKDYKELKNIPFARDKILRELLLKHFAKQPKIPAGIKARIREQYAEDAPLGGKAVGSVTKYRGTGDTLAKANRVAYSSADKLTKGKSLDPNKFNQMAKNNRLKPDFANKFDDYPANNRIVSADDLTKSRPRINLVN